MFAHDRDDIVAAAGEAARSHDTVLLTESVLAALSFLQAGITSAMPIKQVEKLSPHQQKILLGTIDPFIAKVS